jgi:7-cyano-7-deazaguanine synthase
MKKYAVLSLSGGMDSSTLLLHLLAHNYEVTALSFDYGQKHRVELERASELVNYLRENFIYLKHQIIKLDGLSKLLNSNLVEGGKDVPEGHYEQDNMKDTVVPNRNKIFSSIIQAVALSIANEKNENVKIAMGLHAGDHAIYPDCRQEFRDADFEAFKLGNWGADKVSFYTPYLEVNKFEILQDGVECCAKLGIQFDEVYKRTNTSYKPILVYENAGSHYMPTDKFRPLNCYERWYSDYKSAASVERIEAFIKLGRPDPVAYADETGPVSWELAKSHVEQILKEHQTNK